jgi:proteic killer suppression protein
MILSYRNRDTEALDVHGVCHRRWRSFQAAAGRKLDMLNAASVVSDLRSPPGNRLEKLSGDREGQWSIRINDQWRICFRWDGSGPEDVEIVDCH